jgi:hypothetical protein
MIRVADIAPLGFGWDESDWRAWREERAGIAEYDGGLTRAEAEAQADWEVSKAKQELAATNSAVVHAPIVHAPKPAVVHAAVVQAGDAPIVHAASSDVVHALKANGEDRYRDRDARRSYRREWMRKRRAAIARAA